MSRVWDWYDEVDKAVLAAQTPRRRPFTLQAAARDLRRAWRVFLGRTCQALLAVLGD